MLSSFIIIVCCSSLYISLGRSVSLRNYCPLRFAQIVEQFIPAFLQLQAGFTPKAVSNTVSYFKQWYLWYCSANLSETFRMKFQNVDKISGKILLQPSKRQKSYH